MKRHISPLVLLGAFLVMTIGAVVFTVVYAHDDPRGPHIHIKGTITVPGGGPPPTKAPDVKQVGPGVFPGLPCDAFDWRRPMDYNPSNGSYDLIVYLKDSKMGGGGKGQDCRSILSTTPTINVDRSQIRMDLPGYTVAPR